MKKKVLISLLLVITILTAIFSTVYATDEQAEIPSKYDLRNDIGIKVENQGNRDWCGYYVNTKIVETYLQKTKELNYNLSEAYLNYEFDGLGKTFVLDNDFPNKDYNKTEANTNKYNQATEKAVVTNVTYSYNTITTEKIKKYIMKYGGVCADIVSKNKQFENYKGGICYKSSNGITDHGIVIIGWDDNYSKDNFYYEKPQNDGAWLILNSWGSNWGNNGTAWVSYEDYYNLVNNATYIKSLTLSNGETIETKLEDEKQEETKEIETPVINQEIIEPNKTSNIQNIFIIVFAVAVILLIIGIILKSKKHK